jgi:hypothetical protein
MRSTGSTTIELELSKEYTTDDKSCGIISFTYDGDPELKIDGDPTQSAVFSVTAPNDKSATFRFNFVILA